MKIEIKIRTRAISRRDKGEGKQIKIGFRLFRTGQVKSSALAAQDFVP